MAVSGPRIRDPPTGLERRGRPGVRESLRRTTEFVDIRGVKHQGGPGAIGSSHQMIFDVLVPEHGHWRAVAFHNTLVTV